MNGTFMCLSELENEEVQFVSAVLSSAPPPSVILTVTVQTVAALHSLPIYSDQSRVAFFIWFTTK